MRAIVKSGTLHLLLLTLIVGVVFGNTLLNGFVWDDYPILINNDAYRTFDPVRYFTTPANGLEYLPVRDLSYALDYALWGEKPLGFHLTNLILYLVNVLSVYLLAGTAWRFCRPEETDGAAGTVAFWTAAFFAVLPLHSEVVAFVTARNALLSGLFTFLAARSFLLYLDCSDRRRWRHCAAALVLFLLALFSKATGIFLPVFFALCLVGRGRRPTGRDWAGLAPFALLAAGCYLLFTGIAGKVAIIDQSRGTTPTLLAGRLAEAVQIPFFYLYKLLLPVGLLPSYPDLFVREPLSLPAIAAAGGLLILAGGLLAVRRRLPTVLFATCWYATALVPVLHLLPTATTVADRYAYLPSFAWCLLLGAGTAELAARRSPRLAMVLATAVTVVWAGLAARQNRIWQSEETLWSHTLARVPDSRPALANLGWTSFTRGDLETAGNYFDRLGRLAPDDPVYQFFQGYLALERREFAGAVTWFKRAYAGRAGFVDALYYVAKSYDQAGDRAQAIEHYRYVLQSTAPDAPYYKARSAERLQGLGAP
jgi:hypothetical protein